MMSSVGMPTVVEPQAFTGQIFRTTSDAVEFRSISLTVSEAGAISLDAFDMGPTAESCWGADDYEFGVRVPSRFAADLLSKLFAMPAMVGQQLELPLSGRCLDLSEATLLARLIFARYVDRENAVEEFRSDLGNWGIAYEPWYWI